MLDPAETSQANTDGRRSGYETMSLSELMQGPTEIDWVLKPFIPPVTTLLLFGDSGSGKTWLACDLALALASGGKWLGHFAAKQQTVLVVDEENSALLLRLRLGKMLRARGFNGNTELPIHFAIGTSLNLTPDCPANRQPITSIGALRLLNTIERTRAQVVICDSLTRIHRSNENASHEMAAVFSNIKQIATQTDASFVLAHHTNKLGSRGSGRSGDRIRGSTDIRAFCDTTVLVEKRGRALIVTLDKSRWAEPIDGFGVDLVSNDDEGTVSLVYRGSSGLKTNKPDTNERIWDWTRRQLASGPKLRQDLVNTLPRNLCSIRKLDDVLAAKVAEGQVEKATHPTDKRQVSYGLAEESARSTETR